MAEVDELLAEIEQAKICNEVETTGLRERAESAERQVIFLTSEHERLNSWGDKAVDTLEELRESLKRSEAEVTELKAKIVKLEAKAVEASFAQEASYMDVRERERTEWK